MRAFRMCLTIAMLTTCGFGAVTIGAMPMKTVDTSDTDVRLMAMLFVSFTSPR